MPKEAWAACLVLLVVTRTVRAWGVTDPSSPMVGPGNAPAASANSNPPVASPPEPPPTSGPAPAPAVLSRPSAPLPPEPSRAFHWTAGLAMPGMCVHDDQIVGGSGFCGDVFGGFLLPIYGNFRAAVELGLGYMHPSTAGYPDIGLVEESGGKYASLRASAGGFVSPLFMIQGGGELRLTFINFVNPGFRFFAELGTRLFVPGVPFFDPGIELGVRQSIGCDGVVVSGKDGMGNSEGNRLTCSLVNAYGTTAFARVLFP
jgi:hypothetical protein